MNAQPGRHRLPAPPMRSLWAGMLVPGDVIECSADGATPEYALVTWVARIPNSTIVTVVLGEQCWDGTVTYALDEFARLVRGAQ